jgi:hypothetical protein
MSDSPEAAPAPPRLPIPGAFAYDLDDVALLTRTSRSFVQKAVKNLDLQPVYPHSDARFTPAAVAEWVASWKPEPPPPGRR